MLCLEGGRSELSCRPGIQSGASIGVDMGITVRAGHTLHSHAYTHLWHVHSHPSHRTHSHTSHWHAHYPATHPASTTSHAHRSSSHTSRHASSILEAAVSLHTSHRGRLETALKATSHWLLKASSIVTSHIVCASTTVIVTTTIASVAPGVIVAHALGRHPIRASCCTPIGAGG